MTSHRTRRSFESTTRGGNHPAPAPNIASSSKYSSSLDDRFFTRHVPTSVIDFTHSANNDSRTTSQAPSIGFSSGFHSNVSGDYFRSRRVKKGEVERPWLEKKDPREKWLTIFPLIGFLLGLGITGLLIWQGIRSVAVHNYCEVFSDNFTSWNSSLWTKEVEVGGFG